MIRVSIDRSEARDVRAIDDDDAPVIVSALRTPVGKAPRGSLRDVRPDSLAARCLTAALERAQAVEKDDVDDVILGCAYPEAQQGRNIGRMAALLAGFPVEVAGATVNRLCASGLEAIAIASQRVASGSADVMIAGGVESMSQIPRGGHAPSPNPELVESNPDAYLTMGLTAERVARHFEISRADQDAFALESHLKAAGAQQGNRFADEILPVAVISQERVLGRWRTDERLFAQDEGVRRDATLERLANLKPVFMTGGSVTAGNSSQTSDGAAACVIVSRRFARERQLAPLGKLIAYTVAGCPPEIMGIGPIVAIPKLLAKTRLTLEEIDLIELNEAFACQSLAIIRSLGIDASKVNVNGGAIALGHPLGATGAKLSASLLHEMKRRNARYGMVTMCVGGGMGAAGLFERIESLD